MTNNGKGKGKAVAGKNSGGKRKGNFDDDKTGGLKRKNRGIVQFFEEEAADVNESDDSDFSDFSDDSYEDEFATMSTMRNDTSKGQSSLPFVNPKQELVDEEEFDRMMEERVGAGGSRFFSFAGDEFEDKPMDHNAIHHDVKESIPTIWKVKCTVGRERLSAICLMQKFVHLKSLDTKLQIISAFSVDHMKGILYIEAERQCDINEACQGITGIYATRVQPVPRSEVFHLFSVKIKKPEISEGMWARIKGGHYKGDLAQVVAVNNAHKKVTVKLVPRIDLQALAAKLGGGPGGYSRQKAAVPAPRLISSTELEEFRPLIQIKHDRETRTTFQVLDGLQLKDGYVYKKLSPDSLSFWGVVPTEEQILKFGSSENNESNDMEWLSNIYGDSKKKRVIVADKGDGKGEGSSGSGAVNGFELYALVCFRKKDFGVIIGMDKDGTYKILKDSPEGPTAVTVQQSEIKSALCDLKLTAQDFYNKTIVANDNVRVMEGPSKDKQGIVRHIYRGIVFLYDGNEENGGYITARATMCEKIKLAVGDFSGGKDSEPGPLVFDDQPSSPRSPLSPKKPWQARENDFNRGDSDSLFAIGQTLRIRIGPLKGYLCRVTGIRRSDVTVKLDSQQKFLTVKSEHLSVVQGKSTAVSTSGDPDSSSLKPFDLLGTEGSSGGWMNNSAGTSTGGGGWNAGETSAERSAWSNHSAPSSMPGSTSDPFSSEGNAEDNAWGTKKPSTSQPSWGAAVSTGITSDQDQSGGWGKSGGSEDTAWDTKKTSTPVPSWGAAVNTGVTSDPDQSGGWGKRGGSSGQVEINDNQNNNWNNKTNNLDGNEASGWGSKSNLNTSKASDGESSGWNSIKMPKESSATGWGQDNGFKSGSNDGGSGVDDVGKPSRLEGNNNWNATTSPQVNSGWSENSSVDDIKGKGNDQGGWGAGKASDGSIAGENHDSAWGSLKSSSSNAGWKSGLNEGVQEGSNWGNKKSGSSTVAETQGSDWGKTANWSSASGNAGGSQGDGFGQKSNWQSGSTNDSNEKKSVGCSSAGWGQGTAKSDSADGSKQVSNWGTLKPGSSSENGNLNSNWSSGHTDPGKQDSSWGKKSDWNSGNSGSQASDIKNSNWNSGNSDSQTQDSNWGKKSSWNSESGGASEATNWKSNGNWGTGNASSGGKLGGVTEGPNETSDVGGGGNWRGGYRGRGRGGSDRGGFRGRGFRGRGERGDSGGRGERGGGFGGRWGSDRGFGGRGRGRNDQPGGWNNSRDSGEDGSSDWKNKNGSGAWNQNSGDKKDGGSWSHENADKERPSNPGGGSNKQWQSWGSASGGASGSWNNGPGQVTESKDGGAGWGKGTDSAQENISAKGDSWASHAPDKGQSSSWNQSAADGAGGSWGKKNDGGDKGGW